MSTYEPGELLQQWKNGKIDTPQAIGHILQHLVLMQQHHSEHTRRTGELAGNVDELTRLVTGAGGQQPPPQCVADRAARGVTPPLPAPPATLLR